MRENPVQSLDIVALAFPQEMGSETPSVDTLWLSAQQQSPPGNTAAETDPHNNAYRLPVMSGLFYQNVGMHVEYLLEPQGYPLGSETQYDLDGIVDLGRTFQTHPALKLDPYVDNLVGT
jgi:hypothetical protein